MSAVPDNSSYRSEKSGELDKPQKDFFCELCQAKMANRGMWDSHINGKKHLKMLRKSDEAKKVGDPESASNVGSKIVPKVNEFLKDVKEPIVGLDYITETQYLDPLIHPSYYCNLCKVSIGVMGVIDHVTSTKHQFNYIAENDREGYEIIKSMQASNVCIDSLCEERAATLEKNHGRGTVEAKLEQSKFGSLASMRKRRQESGGVRAGPSKRYMSYREDEEMDNEARAQDFLRRIPFMDIDSKLKIISNLSCPVISNDEEALAVIKLVTMMQQFTLQCKLKLLSPELQQSLERYTPSETGNRDPMIWQQNRLSDINCPPFSAMGTSRQPLLDPPGGNRSDAFAVRRTANDPFFQSQERGGSTYFQNEALRRQAFSSLPSSSSMPNPMAGPISYPALDSYRKLNNPQPFRHGF